MYVIRVCIIDFIKTVQSEPRQTVQSLCKMIDNCLSLTFDRMSSTLSHYTCIYIGIENMPISVK